MFFGCVFACRIRIADRLLFFPFSDEDVLFADHRWTNKQNKLQVLFMGSERERERGRERESLFSFIFYMIVSLGGEFQDCLLKDLI